MGEMTDTACVGVAAASVIEPPVTGAQVPAAVQSIGLQHISRMHRRRARRRDGLDDHRARAPRHDLPRANGARGLRRRADQPRIRARHLRRVGGTGDEKRQDDRRFPLTDAGERLRKRRLSFGSGRRLGALFQHRRRVGRGTLARLGQPFALNAPGRAIAPLIQFAIITSGAAGGGGRESDSGSGSRRAGPARAAPAAGCPSTPSPGRGRQNAVSGASACRPLAGRAG